MRPTIGRRRAAADKVFNEAQRNIEKKNIPEAIQELKAYISDENATKKSEAARLLAEVELVVSKHAALDTLEKMGDDDFQHFQLSRHYDDVRITHRGLVKQWDSTLTSALSEAMEKRAVANAKRIAELRKSEVQRAAQLEKRKNEQAEQERRKREEDERPQRERQAEQKRQREPEIRKLEAELSEANEEKSFLEKKYNSVLSELQEAEKWRSYWAAAEIRDIRAGFSKEVLDTDAENRRTYEGRCQKYKSQLEEVEDSIQRVSRKIHRIEQELGALKE